MKTLSLLLVILSTFGSQAWADMAHPWRDEDSKHGYTQNVDPDQEEMGEILYTVEDPYKNEVQLKDRLFDEKLSKEISTQYYEKFGRTEAEIMEARTPYLNTNFSQGQSMTFTEKDYQDQQSSFGQYIIRRVGEYQFDQAAKTNPDVKRVQEVKEKVENVNVFDLGEFRLRANYQLAANTIVAKIVNPYAQVSFKDEIALHERVFEVSKDWRNYTFSTDVYFVNPTWDLIARKSLSSTLSVSFTYSPYHFLQYTDPSGSTVQTVSERRYLAAINYKF